MKLELYVPDQEQIRGKYLLDKNIDPLTPFPYWAKIWPSALAMAEFLQKRPGIIRGKKVLELAAGLGLPSLVAAGIAKEVCCSDYLPEAVSVLHKTISYNRFDNLTCTVLDWNILPDPLTTDILLLSDVNYAPTDFDQVIRVCEKFLQQGTTILLSTPGRIMAKTFVNQLEEWICETHEISIHNTDLIYLYIMKSA